MIEAVDSNWLDRAGELDSSAWERFFDVRLRALYGSDEGDRYRAFDFRSLEIPRGESHIDDIRRLVDKLDPNTAGLQLRQGIKALIRHAPYPAFPVRGMADLIQLVGVLRMHESLDAFVPVLGTGTWGQREPTLLHRLLGVLLMLSRSDEAYRTAMALVTSKHFEDGYAFDAFTVMARSNPSTWSSAWALVGHRVVNSLRAASSSEDHTRASLAERLRARLAETIADAVPLSELATGLSALRPEFREDGTPSPDLWLCETLFKRRSPLELHWSTQDPGDPIVIVNRLHPSIRAPVPRAFEPACIHFRLVDAGERAPTARRRRGTDLIERQLKALTPVTNADRSPQSELSQ